MSSATYLGYVDTAGNGRLWVAMQVMEGTTLLGSATPTWTMIQLDNTAPSPVDVADHLRWRLVR